MFKQIVGLGILGFTTTALGLGLEVDPALAAKHLPLGNERVIHRVADSAVKSTLTKYPKSVAANDAKKGSHAKKDKKGRSVQDPHFHLLSVELTGAKTYPEKFQAILNEISKDKIGKSVALSEVVQLARMLEARYQQEGYLFFQVIVPMQKFASSQANVKFEVIEVVKGHVDKYKIEVDAPSYVSEVLDSYGRAIVASKPIDTQLIERSTLLANDIPGLRIHSQFVSVPHTDEALNMTIRGEQDDRVRGFLSHNNRGTSYIGRGLVTLGLSKPSLFTTDELKGAVSFSLPRREQLMHGELDYRVILGAVGTQLHLGASRTLTKPGFSLSAQQYVGSSRNYKLKVVHPYLRTLHENIFLGAGASWTDSDLDQRFLYKKLYGDSVRNVFMFLDYDLLDQYQGINEISLKVVKGLKIYGASNTRDRRMDIIYLSRNQGRTNNLRIDASYERVQPVSQAMSLMAGVKGQFSNVALLAVDQFGYGGQYYGRGYDQSAIIGDTGVAAKLEWRYDLDFNLCTLPWVQTYVFYDIGQVWNHDKISQKARTNAASAGMGLRYALKKYLDGGLELNKAMTRSLNVEGNKNPRIFYYFTFNF